MTQLRAVSALQDELGDTPMRLYQASSLGRDPIPANPEHPFAQYQFLDSPRHREVYETSTATTHVVRFYVYDAPGDYSRIERVLKLISNTVAGLVGMTSPTGTRCSGAEWTGMSTDLFDRVTDTIFKFGTCRLTASQ